ncbi:hypothetical protein L6164_004155 [Bauhinia variegata]|uniref:Uncharacterized protein n=1 Tax=Bauhinia variegata TaxID=167791 RepID=A0ACB9Q506_BAUVA|nr:hypothetical protein L6164_004155 [Bauhinia variegata]
MKLFNIKSMESYEYIRREERANIMRQLFESANKPFLLKDFVSTLNLSIISRMVWGKHYNENDKNDRTKHLLEEYIELNGCANFGDFIPFIGNLDFQGLIKRMKVWAKEWDEFLDNMIDEHIEKRKGVKDYVNKDMLDILVEESADTTLDPPLDRLSIKGYTQDLIIGIGLSNRIQRITS